MSRPPLFPPPPASVRPASNESFPSKDRQPANMGFPIFWSSTPLDGTWVCRLGFSGAPGGQFAHGFITEVLSRLAKAEGQGNPFDFAQTAGQRAHATVACPRACRGENPLVKPPFLRGARAGKCRLSESFWECTFAEVAGNQRSIAFPARVKVHRRVCARRLRARLRNPLSTIVGGRSERPPSLFWTLNAAPLESPNPHFARAASEQSQFP